MRIRSGGLRRALERHKQRPSQARQEAKIQYDLRRWASKILSKYCDWHRRKSADWTHRAENRAVLPAKSAISRRIARQQAVFWSNAGVEPTFDV